MEKLLNAIASRLTVRIVVEEQPYETLQGLNITMQIFELRDVTDEVRELFKKELKNHLLTKLQNMEVGDEVEYCFDCNHVRVVKTLMENANDNLAEVLLKLPTLNHIYGERYNFPPDTYIRFKLSKKCGKDIFVRTSKVCPWIIEAYSKQ